MIGDAAGRTPQPPPRSGAVLSGPPEQRIQGNGKKYYLHLLQPEQLEQRGILRQEGSVDHQRLPGTGAQQRMAGGAVLPGVRHQPLVPRDQTRPYRAHGALGTERALGTGGPCGPQRANPTVSEYTRREARRHQHKRADGKRFYG